MTDDADGDIDALALDPDYHAAMLALGGRA